MPSCNMLHSQQKPHLFVAPKQRTLRVFHSYSILVFCCYVCVRRRLLLLLCWLCSSSSSSSSEFVYGVHVLYTCSCLLLPFSSVVCSTLKRHQQAWGMYYSGVNRIHWFMCTRCKKWVGVKNEPGFKIG